MPLKLFILSFSKNILGICYVLGTTLGAYVLVAATDNK